MSIILIEAGLITSLGGLLGLGVGLSLVLAFARSLGFYFASLGVPFTWPPDWAIPDDPDRERAMILRTSGLIKRYGAGAGYEAVSEAELTLRGNSSRSSVGQAPASRRFWR
jgi:hypothetical protein